FLGCGAGPGQWQYLAPRRGPVEARGELSRRRGGRPRACLLVPCPEGPRARPLLAVFLRTKRAPPARGQLLRLSPKGSPSAARLRSHGKGRAEIPAEDESQR